MESSLPSVELVKEQLLDDVRHEDDQGLWEVVWTLNGTHPDVPLPPKLALAPEAVFGLLQDDVIALWVAKSWPTDLCDGHAPTAAELDRLRTEDAPGCEPPAAQELLVFILDRTRR